VLLELEDLPEDLEEADYNDLQKVAGTFDGINGNGKKKTLIAELKKQRSGSPDDSGEDPQGGKEDNPPETEESGEEVSETPENEREPELDYTSDRDHKDEDLLGRENPEEEVLEEAENREEEYTSDEEDLPEDPERKDTGSEVEKLDAEVVEEASLDPRLLRGIHKAINQGLKFFLGRKGYQVDDLTEEDLKDLGEDTEMVARRKLDSDSQKALETGSGISNILVTHALKVLDGKTRSEEPEDQEEEEDQEKPIEKKDDGTDETEGFGSESPI
jgi:hypothetical protein